MWIYNSIYIQEKSVHMCKYVWTCVTKIKVFVSKHSYEYICTFIFKLIPINIILTLPSETKLII